MRTGKATGGRIERATPMSLIARIGGVVAVPKRRVPPLSDEVVRMTLERERHRSRRDKTVS
jgi:hypothetical protein